MNKILLLCICSLLAVGCQAPDSADATAQPEAADRQAVAAADGAVPVDGAELRYVVEGQGAPCIVVGSRIYYPRTFSETFKRALRCAYVDTRTFTLDAGPAADGTYDMATVVRDIEAARTTLGFDQIVVVGHSMHALMGLEYARAYPRHTYGVVMLGMSPVWGETAQQAQRELWESASEERKRIHQQRSQALTDTRVQQMSPGERLVHTYVTNGALYWYDATYDAGPLWTGVETNMDLLEQFMAGSLDGYDITEGPPVEVPVLVVVGRHDYVASHGLWTEERKAPLKNLDFHVLERSGHTPQLESLAEFDGLLLDWLRAEALLRRSGSESL